jgi:hypothetical protein
MKIKYYYRDHFYQITELSEEQINLKVTYFSDAKISNKMILNSWKIFISDIHELKKISKKMGRKKYFEESINFSMINLQSSEHKIIPDNNFNKTMFTKLPYLYRDLEKSGRYIFPIFMKSLYRKEKDIEQTSGLGKTLISSRYFPKNNIDVLVSDRKNQDSSKTKKLQEFLEYFCSKSNINENIQVVLQKYLDDTDEYYVECMEIENSKSNFFDQTLESLELWKYIYNTVVDFEINKVTDYKILLDKIVLDGQKFI